MGVPSQATEQLFQGRDEDPACTEVPVSSQMHFYIIIMQEHSDFFLKSLNYTLLRELAI